MSWVKIDSSVSRNRKFVQAGGEASWLWICGLTYCQEGLTDGFIPDEALKFLGLPNARKLAARLVRVRLWEPCDGGWMVHDYLQHNRSSEKVLDLRSKRQALGAKGGEASGVTRREANREANSFVKSEANCFDDVKQTSNPVQISTATATEQTRDARARPQSIVRPRRKDAAWEGARVYVPQRLHVDLIADRNQPTAERDLLAWYADVDETWTYGAHKDDPTGGDMFTFWRARYAEQWQPAVSQARVPEWAK